MLSLTLDSKNVEADNREQAISTLKESLARKLETFEVISLELPTTNHLVLHGRDLFGLDYVSDLLTVKIKLNPIQKP